MMPAPSTAAISKGWAIFWYALPFFLISWSLRNSPISASEMVVLATFTKALCSLRRALSRPTPAERSMAFTASMGAGYWPLVWPLMKPLAVVKTIMASIICTPRGPVFWARRAS